jgi:hypothetical protein
MKPEINLELFASKIKEKRGELTYTKAANQIGFITSGTLARCEQAKLPDLNTFIRICRWLDLPTDTFVVKKIRYKREPSFIEQENLIKQNKMNEGLWAGSMTVKPPDFSKYHAGIDPVQPDEQDKIVKELANPATEWLKQATPEELKKVMNPVLVKEMEDYLDAMADMKGTETPDHNFFEPEEPLEKRHMPFADAKRGLSMVDNLQHETVTLGGVPFNFISVPGMEPGKTYFLNETDELLPFTMVITPEGEDEKIPLREQIAASIDLQQNNEVPNWVKDLMPKEGDDIEIVSEKGVITMIISEPDEPRQCPVTNDQCAEGCLPGEPCCLKKISGPDDSECTPPDLSDDELTKMNTP